MPTCARRATVDKRVYRLLLRLLPASFRAEYGEEMCAVFEARRRERPALLFWPSVIADVAASALALHLELLRQDLHWTMRALRRAPGFAVTSIVVAALGTGAAIAAFTLLNHVLLRPLPFPEPERLVALFQAETVFGTSRAEATPPNFEDWRAMSRSFSSMGAYVPSPIAMGLSGAGEPRRFDGWIVNAAAFRTIGVQPMFGRALTDDDDAASAGDVAIVSHRLATSLFGEASTALGRSVRLNERPFTIVGVMAAGFAFPSRNADVWIPFRSVASPANLSDRRNHILNVVARLRPGVTLESARAEMATIARQLEQAYPEANEGVGVEVVPFRDIMEPRSRTLVVAVFGAALCLLLIACTNLANLLLARTLDRRPEIAVRVALGAGRERVIRQLLTESLVLAVTGSALGLALAALVVPSLAVLVPSNLPIGATPELDARVMLFAGSLVLATSVAFGAGPAWRRAGSVDATAVRVRTASGQSAGRLRASLVVAEVAGTVVLLVAAGLLLKAMWRVQAVDPGFRTENVLTLQMTLPVAMPAGARRALYADVLPAVRVPPGVRSASFISFLPMTFPAGNLPITAPGVVLDEEVRAHTRFVTPEYFATLGVPILTGRDVRDSDSDTSARVVVVSESLAQMLWNVRLDADAAYAPGREPIGRVLNLLGADREVIGVVGDIAVRGLEAASLPQVYLPADQLPAGLGFYAPKDLVLRSDADPTTLVPAVRQIIGAAAPDLPISNIRLLGDIVDSQTATRRAQLGILTTFGGIAFVLAGMGIFGLLSFAVSSRAQEIGVRLALGAAPRDVLAMFLRQGTVLGVGGLLVAAPLAYLAARSMSALLFGVGPADPLVFAAASILAFILTLAGSLRPALRAARVDPMLAIRSE